MHYPSYTHELACIDRGECFIVTVTSFLNEARKKWFISRISNIQIWKAACLLHRYLSLWNIGDTDDKFVKCFCDDWRRGYGNDYRLWFNFIFNFNIKSHVFRFILVTLHTGEQPTPKPLRFTGTGRIRMKMIYHKSFKQYEFHTSTLTTSKFNVLLTDLCGMAAAAKNTGQGLDHEIYMPG